MQELEATYNGIALQLEGPLDLAKGTRVRVLVESIVPNDIQPSDLQKPKTFLQMAQSLKLQGAPDWSETIDQDIYGEILSDEG
jgi:hypothetical protein